MLDNTIKSRLLVFLLLCIPACTTGKRACLPNESWGYETEAWECSGVRVKYVPWYLPRTLQVLLMTGTAIPSLDEDSFRGRDLNELKTLHLSGGQLTSVGPNAFCPLTALTVLHLDHNRLEILDKMSVSCNKYLRTLSLVGNTNLHQLPQLDSSSVEHLYLDNCSLTSIDVSTFESMPALQVLSLTGNPDLHCPSLTSQFKHARPDLLVICEDPLPQFASTAFPDDEQRSSTKSLNETDSLNKDKQNSASRIPLPVAVIAAMCIVIIIPFQ